MLAPLKFFAASALLGVGCFASNQAFQNVQDTTALNAQIVEDAKSKASYQPTQAYIDMCGSLARYGELYVNTCSYLADQCYTQRVVEGKDSFEIKLHALKRTLYKGDSYETCLDKSRYFTKRFGPLPRKYLPSRFKWPLGNHLLFQIASQSYPFDGSKSSDETQAHARRLLIKHRLMNEQESIGDVIGGRIVDARIFDEEDDRLIIMVLDVRGFISMQREIQKTTKQLYSRGASLIGVEGFAAFEPVPCIPALKVAGNQLACDLGTGVIVGMEEGMVHDIQDIGLNLQKRLDEGPIDADVCSQLREIASDDAKAYQRSALIFSNIQKAMSDQKAKIFALIVSGGHVRDLQALCDAEGVNYIAIATPTFDPMIADHIDYQYRGNAEIAEHLEEINSVCEK